MYLPDIIYRFRSELRLLIGIGAFMLLMPLSASFIMHHSMLPGTGALAATQPHPRTTATPKLTGVSLPSEALPAVPTDGVTWPAKGIVMLEFGASDLPYQASHTGIDIAGKSGDPVVAFKAGTVIEVGHLTWGYGTYVKLDHGNDLISIYGHLSRATVSVGQTVNPGEIVGREGRTGWATGPHVHFEVRRGGVAINPRKLVGGNPSR